MTAIKDNYCINDNIRLSALCTEVLRDTSPANFGDLVRHVNSSTLPQYSKFQVNFLPAGCRFSSTDKKCGAARWPFVVSVVGLLLAGCWSALIGVETISVGGQKHRK
jgi:hypothetical protein